MLSFLASIFDRAINCAKRRVPISRILPRPIACAESQYDIGLAYILGTDGIPEDHEAGLSWMEDSAVNGSPRSQLFLGNCLLTGKVFGKVDPIRAVGFLKMASDAGNAGAQAMYGRFLVDGKYVKENRSEGLRLIQASTDVSLDIFPAQDVKGPQALVSPANVPIPLENKSTPHKSAHCNACTSSPIDSLFIPCGHAWSCVACAKLLVDGHKDKKSAFVPCPVCNEPISRVGRLFHCGGDDAV